MTRIGKPGDAKRRNDIKSRAGQRRMADATATKPRCGWTVTMRGLAPMNPTGRMQIAVYRVADATLDTLLADHDLRTWMRANGLTSAEYEALADDGRPAVRASLRLPR